MSLAERLKSAMDRSGISQKELADRVSVSQAAVSMWIKGKRDPYGDTLRRIADVLGTTTDFLLGRDEFMCFESVSTYQAMPKGGIPAGGPMVSLPIVGTIRAGAPVIAEENRIGYHDVPAERIRGGQYFYLRVEGDSMVQDGIMPGGLVLVRMQEQLDPRDIAVVIIDGENATVKHWRPDHGQVMLYGSNMNNPDAMPRIYPADEVRFIGKVVSTEKYFE